MSNNNPHRTSPRFSSSPSPTTINKNAITSNTTTSSTSNNVNTTSPTSKRNKVYNSNQDQNCATNAAAILTQTDLNNVAPNNVQFYIQKLGLLYHNLEGRVQKLEHIFADQLFRASRGVGSSIVHNNAIYPADNNNNNNTGSPYEFNAGTIVPSNCGTSSSSTICSILEPVTKEISKSDLDDYCLPLLQKRAAPSIGELNSIVMNLKKKKYSDLDNKFILSKVREWFRRKREYMSQRIFNICSKKFGHLSNNPEAVRELLIKARNNPEFVVEIGREANLEILNEASAWEFCSEKIASYFENIANNAYP